MRERRATGGLPASDLSICYFKSQILNLGCGCPILAERGWGTDFIKPKVRV